MRLQEQHAAKIYRAKGDEMSDQLTQFEVEILEECAGMREPRSWGAAVGVALEFLDGCALTRHGTITESGRAKLKESEK